MAILAVGTTPAEFYDGSPAGVMGSGSYHPSYVEESIRLDVTAPSSTRDITPVTELWLTWHSRFQYDQSGSSALIQAIADNGDVVFNVRSGSYGEIRCQYDVGAGLVTVSGSTYRSTQSTTRYDARILLDATDGTIEWYVNGSLQASATGLDLTAGGTRATLDQFLIGPCTQNSTDIWHSAIIAADEDTRNMEYIQLLPKSDGALQEWTGSYTDIDEVGFDDGDSILSKNPGQQSTFGVGTLTTDFDSGYDVKAVAISTRAYKGTPTAYDMKHLLKSGSTEDASAALGIDTTKRPYQTIWATNPDTAAAFTVAEAKAVEIGVETHSAA